ncbi:MAG TPA: SRPBCC family protein [Ferruginibacter sp.]|nr:SRPBCC family protein [Ferruginibacter sp.]HMP22084.1 SRPBCC family protein [Ferruginibacter sp.]
MKIIKRIVFAIGALVLLALVVALFVPKAMKAEREIVIAKPKEQVFDYIKYLKNQDNYSKWALMDPDMKKEYRGTDGTVGFVSAWESEKDDVGKGEQEIKAIEEGKRIDFELRFVKPFESTAQAYMLTDAVDSSHTKVSWGFSGNMAWPINIFRLFMDPEKAIGDDFAAGLSKLKAILEQQQ